VFAKETLIPQTINKILIFNLQHECQLLNFAYHCFSQDDTHIDNRNCRELEIKINLNKQIIKLNHILKGDELLDLNVDKRRW
jgi:hypothetical protein